MTCFSPDPLSVSLSVSQGITEFETKEWRTQPAQTKQNTGTIFSFK